MGFDAPDVADELARRADIAITTDPRIRRDFPADRGPRTPAPCPSLPPAPDGPIFSPDHHDP